jgi:hypothetical protein
MKKAISFSLVLGMIFLPCLGVAAQKPLRKAPESTIKESKRTSKHTTSLANEFENVTALSSGEGTLVRWRMRSETANMGFYIHRIDQNTEKIVNYEIVFGSAAKSGRYPLYGEEYSFLDIAGGPDSVYYVEAVDLDGNRRSSRIALTRFSKDPLEDTSGFQEARERNKQQPAVLESQQLKLNRELSREIESVSSNPDLEKHKWVMSRPGARIDVKTEGIYRVTFEQLETAGFDTGSDKAFWQFYRNGIEQAIRIDEAGSYIEFYGRGVDTPETEIQGYFLINGDTAGKRIGNMVEWPATSSITLPSYNQAFTFKERLNYLDTILNGPAENYWGRTIPTVGANVQFDLTNIDFNNPNSTLEVKVQGFSTGVHNVQVTLNGQVLQPLNGVSQFAFSGTQTVPTSLLRDAALGQGPNILNLASVGPSGDFNLFDSLKVSFARKHSAIQNTLKAYTAGNKKTLISGFTSSNVRMYDITFENEPRLVTNIAFQEQGGSFGTELGGTRARVFFAAEESKILAPFAVNRNDGEVLGTTELGADLIVITYKDFRAKADAWAEYRATQGFAVKVVDIDEIFNEFNYGSPSADSIEAFLSYAFDNWSTRPGYVLLMGDATRDPRNYTGVGNFNLVPTRMVTTVFTETGSDESLVDFNNDGLADMAIGRVPVRLPASVDTIFQKVVNWETNLGNDPLARGALFAVDQFDATNNIDFAAITDRISGELPESMGKTAVLRGQPDYKANLISAMNNVVCDPNCNSKGKYIVNYTGHGSTGTWAGTDFFWLGDVQSMTNDNSESIMTMLTCLNGYFLAPVSQGLAETLLSHTNGGAVATWASTGLTTPDVQEVMARRFYRKIGDGDIPRLGDLIRDAKSVINGGTDVRQSWALLGDPMLKVR